MESEWQERRFCRLFLNRWGRRFRCLDWCFVAETELVDDGRQAAALNKLHRVVVDTLVTADTEDGHDVSMMQLRRGLGLDLEPLALLGVDRRGEG